MTPLRRLLPSFAPLFAVALAVSAFVPAARAAELVPGVDYAEIPDGERLGPDDGRIEVVEVFGYWCHFCAEFEPMLEQWKFRQAKDVRVTYLPLPRSPDDVLATGFFASEANGTLAKTHAATFKGIHEQRVLPSNATLDELTAFYAGLGVEKNRFRLAAGSPDVQARLAPARAFAVRSGVEGTPTLIVNGRYRVLGRSLEDNLRIASALVERERGAR